MCAHPTPAAECARPLPISGGTPLRFLRHGARDTPSRHSIMCYTTEKASTDSFILFHFLFFNFRGAEFGPHPRGLRVGRVILVILDSLLKVAGGVQEKSSISLCSGLFRFGARDQGHRLEHMFYTLEAHVKPPHHTPCKSPHTTWSRGAAWPTPSTEPATGFPVLPGVAPKQTPKSGARGRPHTA